MAPSIEHVWPALTFGWRSVLGTFTSFLGAAAGSAGGVGGGSIFVPTINLILGFDTKSSTALSKCMIMGATLSTVGYNLRAKHPHHQLHLPLIDYDMAMLLQPMLLLGISVGVIFNTVFPTWVLTLVLISIMLGTGLRTSKKAMEAWEMETSRKKSRNEQKLVTTSGDETETRGDYKPLRNADNVDSPIWTDEIVYSFWDTMARNIKWGNVAVLFMVWVAFSILQILQSHSESCSARFWIFNALQVPIAVLAFCVAAVKLYKKKTKKDAEAVLVSDDQESGVKITLGLIVLSGVGSFFAGIIGGLVGLGGGFALGPLLLEFGAHPQVLSATATFTMMFSSSMSVLEYYLLGRFPLVYALYLLVVSMIGGVSGQLVMDNMIKLLGRASLIILLLTSLTILSAVLLGGIGIKNAIQQFQAGEYMGFVPLC